MCSLSALAPLHSCLRRLKVTSASAAPDLHQHQDYSFLSSLTTLTGLHLPMAAAHQHLNHISCCTGLQSLAFKARTGSDTALRAAECAALQHLVHLTQLSCTGFVLEDPTCSFLAALQQLRKLTMWQSLAALQSRRQLPAALAGLTKLTRLVFQSLEQPAPQQGVQAGAGTAAAAGAATAAHAVFPSVRCLCAGGPVPFEAFPSLQEVTQTSGWQPSALCSLRQHCSQLTKLSAGADVARGQAASLLSDAAAAERIRAIRGLSALRSLKCLAVAPNSEAEVAAVASLQQVRHLSVIAPYTSESTVEGLSQLGAARQLRTLQLLLPGAMMYHLGKADAQRLLIAVQHAESVVLRVPAAHVQNMQDIVQHVRLAINAAGVDGPAVVKVEREQQRG
ncbi:hypothetical protein COO60DRAFT_1706253 [Scenedesmus sp. NREL 46B-D3]|nr:hypothetical protein COO60DRAFT_1706253 [Scenedesmus sp. NREL 46B-D3]